MKFDPRTGEFIPDDVAPPPPGPPPPPVPPSDGGKKESDGNGCGCLVLLALVGLAVWFGVQKQKEKERQNQRINSPTFSSGGAGFPVPLPSAPLPRSPGPATFSVGNASIRHNVMINGVNSLEVSFHLSGAEGDGRPLYPGIYFKNFEGKYLLDFDGVNADRGQLAFAWSEVAAGQGELWASTASLSIPYVQLHLASGVHDLTMELLVFDADRTTVLARAAPAAIKIRVP